MKRAKSEHMQSMVLSYLKKRNYTDSESSFKQEFKFEENIREMTTRLSQNLDMSTPNTVAFGVYSIDEYFVSLEELLKFYTDAVDEHPTLIGFVYPTFCHMYLDLVTANRKADAGTFFQHFEGKIREICEMRNPAIEKLAQVIQPSDIESYKDISLIRKKRINVILPASTHALFMRFLHANLNLALLKIVNLHFFIKINEGNNLFDLFSDGPSIKLMKKASDAERVVKKKKQAVERPKTLPAEYIVKQEPVTLSAPSIMSPSTPVSAPPESTQPLILEVDIKTLKSSIQKVHEMKPSVGNIRVHRILDASTGLTHATMSNKFDLISTGTEDSTVKLWDISPGVADIHKPSLSKSGKSGALSPDVSKVHLGCDFYENVKVRLNVTSSAQTKSLRAHSGTVTCSCFSHDDRYLLTSSEDTSVRLWDLSSCKNKAIYRGHIYPIWCITMSNYSFYFATGSYDKTARLWTTERTYPLRTFAGHCSDVESVAFHNNTSYLASADKTIRLWDITSGKTVRLMLGHWAPVLCLAFSPNGKYLASSGEDGRIRMWDIASGNLIKEMRGHEGSVYSLDFSPDGSMLASGGQDSCIRVWNTRTSQTPTTKSLTDINDQKLNPDFIGKWEIPNCNLHTVKFESCNFLHCVAADR